MAYNITCCDEAQELLKVTGSHVWRICGNILKTVQDGDIYYIFLVRSDV